MHQLRERCAIQQFSHSLLYADLICQQVAALQDAAQHTEAGAATTRYTLGSGSSVTLISDGKLLEFATNTSTNSTNGGTVEHSTSLFAVSAALATQLLALVEMHRER
jgi:S-adenosylhomocysteine hydrolase